MVTLRGRVITGESIGTGLGYPTANLDYALAQQHRLHHGVWACRVRLEHGEVLKGVAVVGVPYENNPNRRKFEVHILNWQGTLYGDEITVELVQFMHGIKHYKTTDALLHSIKEDVEEAREILEQ